jgi:hypothetical protein
MTEIGFYALGAFGTEPARVAAVARHIPNAVVYVVGRGAVRDLYTTHNITTIAVKEESPTETDRWLRARNPDGLVMDAYPYGARFDEARRWIHARTQPTYYLRRRTVQPIVFDQADFTAVLNTDEGLAGGTDLHPVLPYDPKQLPSRRQARAALGARDRPLVLIIGRGTTPAYLEFVVNRCNSRGIDHVIVDRYPTMPSLPGADLVVGYVGYNQCEAEAVGVPMAGIVNTADLSQSWRPHVTANELVDVINDLDIRDAPETVTYQDHSRDAAALITGSSNSGAPRG